MRLLRLTRQTIRLARPVRLCKLLLSLRLRRICLSLSLGRHRLPTAMRAGIIPVIAFDTSRRVTGGGSDILRRFAFSALIAISAGGLAMSSRAARLLPLLTFPPTPHARSA